MRKILVITLAVSVLALSATVTCAMSRGSACSNEAFTGQFASPAAKANFAQYGDITVVPKASNVVKSIMHKDTTSLYRSTGCSTGCSNGCSNGCSSGCSSGCSNGCSNGCRY